MPVQIKISATLRDFISDYDPVQGLSLPLESGDTPGTMIEKLGVPLAKVKVIMVNGKHAQLETPLREGDRLGIFPPVGGG